MYKLLSGRRIAPRCIAPITAALLVLASPLAVQAQSTKNQPEASAPTPPAAQKPAGKSETAPEATAKPKTGDAASPKASQAQDGADQKAATDDSGAPGAEAATARDEQGAGETATQEGEAVEGPPTDEEREAARLAFEAGTTAFESGDFVQAKEQFQKAHEAIPSPHAEYWIARSIDQADPADENPEATVLAYERFLSNPGAKHVGEEKVAAAQQRMEELRKLLPATLVVLTEPSGATVTLDGKTLEGVTPMEVQRPPGSYKLEAKKEGYEPLSLEVELEGGITLEQQINLAKTPPPPPPEVTRAVEPVKEPSMVPAYVTLGLGGAGLITGAVFGILALDAKSKFEANPTSELADEVERNALISDMSFGIAVTLGVTGVVLLTANHDDRIVDEPETTARSKSKREAGRIVVAPYGGPLGGGARAQMAF